MAKKSKKVRAVDTKKLAANDKDSAKETPVVKLPAKNASAVQKGATYAVLAGRPSKQAVTTVFTKSGYALSWVARAAKLGVTPEELCEQFKTDPQAVKESWAKATAPVSK